MTVDARHLPVYEQRASILAALETNQVIVVQSPTGSGKTTQLPIILHEAGYSANGVIGVTQPRRIAALSVSGFIARELGTFCPGLVGCKMRFEDKTDITTRIKIMTDGILLQEMKLDPYLSRYNVIMIDEAHERSLNIDFALGLLKRALQARRAFKVIVSSATINAEVFSRYFWNCPIVTIAASMYPVTVIYDPPIIPATCETEEGEEALLNKIAGEIEKTLTEGDGGDILVFLPGERAIKDCMARLLQSPLADRAHMLPLYARLPKEEQEKVFLPAPRGKTKVVLSTNIAETSVTIDGITCVIDSGLAKLNSYNPRTFTSSLDEAPVSRASCNQRRGRAGRTAPGVCYRLYTRDDYATRAEYTTEEIYRTDLSEVVLRMSELGIYDAESFDFISQPEKRDIRGAVLTLNMLGALERDGSLSSTGRLMAAFPLGPRISRIIVEAVLHYPDVLAETLVAAAFLSAASPYVLPVGEEAAARVAHRAFADPLGDFVSYLKLYRAYEGATHKERFCKRYYLDGRVMAEIENIAVQLAQIVGDALGVPVTHGGSMEDYLCCVCAGLIQAVCVRSGRESYKSLTQDRIHLHPGSSMFRENPEYIVAGEIVRTSRMFAMSASPLTSAILRKVDPTLESRLKAVRGRRASARGHERAPGRIARQDEDAARGALEIGGTPFECRRVHGKAYCVLPLEDFRHALAREAGESLRHLGHAKGVLVLPGGGRLMRGEQISQIARAVGALDMRPDPDARLLIGLSVNTADEGACSLILANLNHILRVAEVKKKSKELGFVYLMTGGDGTYRFGVSRGFSTAVSESLYALERLAEEGAARSTAEKEALNALLRTLNSFYKG